ncbi:MAG: beta-galactosidase, partial [Verrucomicrobiota bacterium]
AKAMGLNTVASYMFWSAHEPQPGAFDFTGMNDVAAFVRLAQEEGLYVILRPGPYVCAEWDLGGLPWWLLKDPAMRLRTQDPSFLAPCRRYIQECGRRVAALQVTRGGPILMVQVENEYGSYGTDKVYMGRIRDMLKEAGFEVPLYNCDGLSRLPNDSRDDLLCTINELDANTNLRNFRPNVPVFCTEYYPGWFDHWGERKHRKDTGMIVRDLTAFLKKGFSYNIYVIHGGTSFGFVAGANVPGYQPDITEYDYDCPIGPAGQINQKYLALREMNAQFLPPGEALPDIPLAPATMAIPVFELTEAAPLFSALASPHHAERPVPMEQLNQGYGAVLYRTELPAGPATKLTVTGVHDMGWVFLNGVRVGYRLNRRTGSNTVELPARDQPGALGILVEAMGRINYRQIHDRKGITGPVEIADQYGAYELGGWDMYSLPLDAPMLARLKFATVTVPPVAPVIFRGTFTLDKMADTFLDLRAWTKGMVWVNGHNLGRYWRIGPQQTLYVPGPWLQAGRNEVLVLEYERVPDRPMLAGLAKGIFDMAPDATAEAGPPGLFKRLLNGIVRRVLLTPRDVGFVIVGAIFAGAIVARFFKRHRP